MLEADMRHAQVGGRNGAGSTSETDIVSLFRIQVARRGEALATADEHGGRLSYSELDRRSDALAAKLLDLGVCPEDRCGILLDRTILMVVAVLGILKASAAYVPIDQTNPGNRVRQILETAGARILVTDRKLSKVAPEGGWDVVVLEDLVADTRLQDRARTAISPAALAYVIYTSGSTGVPKGVLIEHRSVTAFVRGAEELYGLTDQDVLVQFSSLAFDVSTFDLFCALLVGGSVHVASAETRGSLERFRNLLRERRITVYMGTPAMIDLLDAADFPALRALGIGGEPVQAALAEKWRPGRRFLNSYGPTETTCAVVAYECQGETPRELPIGRAMPDHRAYVLDTRMNPVAAGAAGDLYIGGPGVGRGYLGLPGQTAAVFLPDPFSAGGGRLYKTGDLACWNPDGDLMFLGRTDNQVKVRGMRVETGEVEAHLLSLPGVAQAAARVVRRGDSGQLVAYVAATLGARLTDAGLRKAMAERLPSYMVPSQIVQTPTLPRTAMGKVDWDALDALQDAPERHDAVGDAEFSAIEVRVLREIVEPILDRSGLSLDDDLLDLGVDSLQVIQIVAAVENVFEIELPVGHFFDAPTISGLAKLIEAAPLRPV